MRVQFLLPDTATEDELTLFVDAATLRPLRYQRLATTPGERVEIDATYGVDADGQRFVDSIVLQGDDREERHLELDEHSFDTDSSAWLWRTLAFSSSLGDQLSLRQRLRAAQPARRPARPRPRRDPHPAGDFLAWQLEARPGVERQTVWLTVDAPHILVRWDLERAAYLLREIVTTRPAN